MKKTLKNLAMGIALGSVMFIITGIIFDSINAGSFELNHYAFTKMALASLAVGLGFSLPSAIYDNDRYPFGMQAFIHMGSGSIIYITLALMVGWIPMEYGPTGIALTILAQLAVAFVIWVCFVFYYRRLAKRMNEKIQNLNQ